VFEGRDRARLALEAGPEGRVVHQLMREDFDRHFAAEIRVVGEVDRGHAAAADFAEDFVTGDFFRNGGRSLGHLSLPSDRPQGVVLRGIIGEMGKIM
jgi:hypothetical protein